MMEAACTSETSVDNYFTRQYIPENKSELHTRHRENLKSHIFNIYCHANFYDALNDVSVALILNVHIATILEMFKICRVQNTFQGCKIGLLISNTVLGKFILVWTFSIKLK
jgi:hypothetical protein